MPTNGGLIGKENLPNQTGRTKITEITSSGNFTVSPNNTTDTADAVMVVAGGGGGQNNSGGGGAGAGGFRLISSHPLPASAVPVTIGAGGANSNTLGASGAEGANSVFGSASNPITSTGGGGGGAGDAARRGRRRRPEGNQGRGPEAGDAAARAWHLPLRADRRLGRRGGGLDGCQPAGLPGPRVPRRLGRAGKDSGGG